MLFVDSLMDKNMDPEARLLRVNSDTSTNKLLDLGHLKKKFLCLSLLLCKTYGNSKNTFFIW